jgi:hypothetical protein
MRIITLQYRGWSKRSRNPRGAFDSAPSNLFPTYELWLSRRESWLRPIDGAEQHAGNRFAHKIGPMGRHTFKSRINEFLLRGSAAQLLDFHTSPVCGWIRIGPHNRPTESTRQTIRLPTPSAALTGRLESTLSDSGGTIIGMAGPNSEELRLWTRMSAAAPP